MAHFAKLGVGNVVETIVVVSNDIATTEQAGVDFLNNLYNTRDVSKLTSYNGKIRKYFAGIGHKYDQTLYAFIPPNSFKSWTLNETTCQWEPPVVKPTLTEEELSQGKRYNWNEETQQWELNE